MELTIRMRFLTRRRSTETSFPRSTISAAARGDGGGIASSADCAARIRRCASDHAGEGRFTFGTAAGRAWLRTPWRPAAPCSAPQCAGRTNSNESKRRHASLKSRVEAEARWTFIGYCRELRLCGPLAP